MIGWKVLTVLLPAVVLAQKPGGETKNYNPSLTMQECSGNQNCQSGKHTNNRSYGAVFILSRWLMVSAIRHWGIIKTPA